jgi:hypothetical protein
VYTIIIRIIGDQIKRAITLGIGALVVGGVVQAQDADALTSGLAFVATQILLTLVYHVYDKYLKERFVVFFGGHKQATIKLNLPDDNAT